MRSPRTIGFRITVGFGLLFIAIILNVIIVSRMFSGIQSAQQELMDVLEPGIRRFTELRSTLHQSADLIRAWDHSGRETGSPLLQELNFNLQTQIPDIHRDILSLSDSWQAGNREMYLELYGFIQDSVIIKTSELIRNPFPYRISDTIPSAGTLNELLLAFKSAEDELDNLARRFDQLEGQASERSTRAYRQARNMLLVTWILVVLAALIIAIWLYFSLVNSIKKFRSAISSMGKGVIPDQEFREGPDEMGQIGTALNLMIKGLRNLSVFAREIGKGNFKSKFSPLSKQDDLGNALIQLRENLQNAAIEEEKRKREDERRNWSNQGIARFSEILRESSGDIRTLAENLISELVKYLDARVGGIFLIHQGESGPDAIELVASYAYDRKKHLQKTIQPGEGLVGRCVQEGSTIFLTDLPKDYIKIKSGLGEDIPKSLLIVPIRLNEIIIGVIEIASLEIFQDFQIEFVERIGTSIASSLAGRNPVSQAKQDQEPRPGT